MAKPVDVSGFADMLGDEIWDFFYEKATQQAQGDDAVHDEVMEQEVKFTADLRAFLAAWKP